MGVCRRDCRTPLTGIPPSAEIDRWCRFRIDRHNEGIVAKTSVEVVQGRGRHARFECTGQPAINDGLAGGDGFGGCLELAVQDAFAFVLVVVIVVDEDSISPHGRLV